MEIGKRGSVSTPRGCEEECTANPNCLYFSHSKTLSDCHFCSDCEFDPSGEGIHYTSWAKLSFSHDAGESHPEDQTDYGNAPLNEATGTLLYTASLLLTVEYLNKLKNKLKLGKRSPNL